jgi:TolB-like protein/DNA-binding winged helix-turn-helix (wHTH) protein/Flp pilus assembly protein TadD
MSNSEEQGGSARPPAQPFNVGAWCVDPSLDELRKSDRTVKLEPRMMRMLCVLAEHPGEVVSANDLLDKVWPGVIVGPNSVYQAIAQLRRLLGDDGEEPQYIATVARKGYRLIAPVRAVDRDRANGPTPNKSRVTRLVAVVVTVVAIGLSFWLLRSGTAPVARVTATPLAIAVLPFADLSADGNNAAFCDGLTEELLNALARVSSLRVTGRTSAFRFRNGGADSREIGAQLGVTHLLEGSVRHSGQRLRVSARLVSTSNGFQVWGNTFDRPRADALAIQAEISHAVVDALEVQLAPAARERLANTPTDQVNAYELYLLGRYHQLQRNPDALQRAIDYHKQALAADPRFALAHAGLADAYMAGYYYQNRTLEATAQLVEPEVDTALRLDPELAEAYAAQAVLRIEQGRRDEAIKGLERAISINPNFGDAYLRLGAAYEYDGKPLQALAAYDQVASLDPLHTQLHVRRCLTLQNLGRYAEAQRACDRGFELQPDIPNALWASGLNAYAQGDLAGAIRQHVQALVRAPHRADIRGELGLLYLDVGLPADAERVFAAGQPQVSAGNIDLQITSLFALVAKNDTTALSLALKKKEIVSNADPRQLIHASLLALVAGNTLQAEGWRAEAVHDQPDLQDTFHPRLYATRWSVCEMCVLSLLDRRRGETLAADKLARFASAWLDEVEASGHRWHGLHYVRATLLAPQGRTEEALASLERAYEHGWRRAWLMRFDPSLANLRAAPRFVSLLERIERDTAEVRERLTASAGGAPDSAR